MTRVSILARWVVRSAAVLAVLLLVSGCLGRRVKPVSIANPTIGPLSIAVAPAINLSGSSHFDPNRFADLMASELSHADGITVIPVSRVLGLLAARGKSAIESPQHAIELSKILGADAILVFAVTEYDPYDPPSIGISAQLYGTGIRTGGLTLDPVALSRQASLSADGTIRGSNGILAQTQRVYDASHASVAADVRSFARLRGGDDSPYGWRKFVVSQQHYIRYCCFATIRTLLTGEFDPILAE